MKSARIRRKRLNNNQKEVSIGLNRCLLLFIPDKRQYCPRVRLAMRPIFRVRVFQFE